MTPAEARDLAALAGALGVQTTYVDAMWRRRTAPTEAVREVLKALLGADIRDPGRTLTAWRAEQGQRLLEPVSVAWQGRAASVPLSLGVSRATTVHCELEEESGRAVHWRIDVDDMIRRSDGAALLPLPELAAGYHRLHVRAGRRTASTLLINAPVRAYQDRSRTRDWGVFLPLYALRSRRSWGVGDFRDLRDLADWISGLGGGSVATLPILAQFYDDAVFDPSPYSPVSRLMWNELFIDIEALDEWRRGRNGRADREAPGLGAALDDLRQQRYVDWSAVAKLKGQALMRAALDKHWPERTGAQFGAFLQDNPEVAAYARFRARTERHGPWRTWPAVEADFEPVVERYHRFVQWAADAQLRELAQTTPAGLYLDLPLGVHATGFDTWRWPQSFVAGVSAGAPPDALATGGQDWGFQPLHPARNREQEYEYVRAYLRHHLRYASRLRIDHVMGLHRLFVIPQGFAARDGTYVRYPADDMYAILCLESHRHRAEISGENLGTVPAYVNRAMGRHGIAGMYVLPFEIDTAAGTIRKPKRGSVASLNTHDLPAFAAWWSGEDIAERERSGRLSRDDEAAERRARKAERETAVDFLVGQKLLDLGSANSPDDVRRALMRYLAESPARLVQANIEDIWGEVEPQNVPGTSEERPNWRLKARLTLEQMRSSPDVIRAMTELASARAYRSP